VIAGDHRHLQYPDKQTALEDAKQKFDDMQEEARKAGVPASVREP
jgi:hypothetical protein